MKDLTEDLHLPSSWPRGSVEWLKDERTVSDASRVFSALEVYVYHVQGKTMLK